MTWLTKNLGWIIALSGLTIGGAIGYGRIAQVCDQVNGKADQIAVMREMDQIHAKLDRIERKLDEFMLQQQRK